MSDLVNLSLSEIMKMTHQDYADAIAHLTDALAESEAEAFAMARDKLHAYEAFEAQAVDLHRALAAPARDSTTIVRLTAERDALKAELASGSFYKEADIDRLMNERDALRAEVERLRGGVERNRRARPRAFD